MAFSQKNQKKPRPAQVSVEALTVFLSIPVTQMPGIQLPLAQSNGGLPTDL
jgi:hypothetical protein